MPLAGRQREVVVEVVVNQQEQYRQADRQRLAECVWRDGDIRIEKSGATVTRQGTELCRLLEHLSYQYLIISVESMKYSTIQASRSEERRNLQETDDVQKEVVGYDSNNFRDVLAMTN